MMLSCTSEVPPSMELPRARSHVAGELKISSSSKPGPSQPSAWGPAIATSAPCGACSLGGRRLEERALAARAGGPPSRRPALRCTSDGRPWYPSPSARCGGAARVGEFVSHPACCRGACAPGRRDPPASVHRRRPRSEDVGDHLRSWPSSALATVQPASISLSTFETGTRTSSKRVSQKGRLAADQLDRANAHARRCPCRSG